MPQQAERPFGIGTGRPLRQRQTWRAVAPQTRFRVIALDCPHGSVGREDGRHADPVEGTKFHSPTMSRYIVATRSGSVTGPISPEGFALHRLTEPMGLDHDVVPREREAVGIAAFDCTTIRTGIPRSKSRSDVARRSRNAAAVAGRLPACTVSSGLSSSAKSTISAAVRTRGAHACEPPGRADSAPGSTFGFGERKPGAGCGLGDHIDGRLLAEQAGRHHLARAAGRPERQVIALAGCRCGNKSDQPAQT